MADLLRGLRTAATDLESMNPQGAKAGRKMRNLKKRELKELVNQFRTIYINYGNKELMGPRKQEKAATNREIGTLAVSKAKENVEIMDSIVRDAHAAVDLNNDTLETLDKQTDQMVRIGQKVTQFQNDLRRANRLLDSFRRRMQSDKLIVCFMFLVVSGILFCIIYSAVDPASDEQLYLPDSAKPPSREQLEEDFGSGRRRMFRLP